jgi:predicted amidohydrolase/ribosomal protein S18 acetylase RimI-like enzyme
MSVDHKSFEKNIVVRTLSAGDFAEVVAVQRRCFPGMEPWPRDQVESQIATFPEGQLVVECDGRVVASSSSLIVELDEYEDGHTWDEIAGYGYLTNHDPEGDTLYGIELMVDPEFRGMRLARRLYDARKRLCVDLNLKRIVVGGRLPGYSEVSSEIGVRTYVEKVTAKELFDPVLTVQISNGFTLKRIIRSYLDEDRASDGYATLLEWVNLDYRSARGRRYQASRPVRICAVQYQMRHVGCFEDFAQQCSYFVDVAAGYRSDYVVFPEILTIQMLSFLPGGRPDIAVRRLAEFTPQYLELMTGLAIEHNVNVVGGSHLSVEDGHLYNIAYLFQRDGSINKQYKLHVTPNERHWWGVQPGRRLEVFDTDCGKVSLLICYDIEFPEVSRRAVEMGARIVFVPFCTDERQGYLRVRYCAQARCVENQIYAVIAGTVGNLPQVDNMDVQYAQSAILTPSDFAFSRDAVGAECTPNIETVVVHDVDLAHLERFRRKGTVQNWRDRRSDLYEVRWHEL